MGVVAAFPGVDLADIYSADESPYLSRWFDSIVHRVNGEPLSHALVILMSEEGEQITYSLSDVRKDQYLGMLHIAMEQGMNGDVAS